MAKESWDKLQSRFLKAHAETGITPKAWCESQGLNYTSARRYIKKSPGAITPKKSAQKSAQKPAKSAQKNAQKPAQKIISEALDDDGESTLSIDPEEFGITLQQAWFAHWFIITKSRVEAYRLAGYEGKGNTAYVGASRLYRNDKIRRAIRYLQDKVAKRYQTTIDEVVHQLIAITKADPNDLMQYRRLNCRYCWGENHLYQWRDIEEFDKAAAKAASDSRPEPEYGGLGFIENLDPNPDCPRCQGEGRGQIFIADTRDLSDTDARWLYDGVQQTKDGLKVLTRNKDAATKLLATYLGMDEGMHGKELRDLDMDRRRLENDRLRREINPPDSRPLEDDYQLQELKPDEPTPDNPIL